MTKGAAAILVAAILSLARPANAQLAGQRVYNNYSYIRRGAPNYGIARGSVFTMAGTNDMTDTTASQGVPLQTTLAGVTITVTVNGVATQAIPYYVSPAQVTAILPSNTPVGNGTVTVSSGGRSVSTSITVVPSAFGLATIPPLTALWPAAVAQDDSEGGQLLTQANAANPGEYITLWGSGLGPVSGDETQYQTPANLTNMPVGVDIGGVSATVTYRGRSIYPGIDQINVIVPAGVSGCNVSVVVIAGGVPSNFATIPVAETGRVCSDPGLVPVTTGEYQALFGKDSVNVGVISLTTLTTTGPGTSAVASDLAYATFQKYASPQFASASFPQVTSIGSCVVTQGQWQAPLMGDYWDLAQLDVGPQVTLNGPDGSLPLPRYLLTGYYSETRGTSPAIVPPGGATFTFDNGSGGADVGPFKAGLSGTLTVPLVWTNSSAITAVNRANGQLITWTGGTPGDYVYISGYSYFNEGAPIASGQAPYYISFNCSAPLSAGQFTVPAAVLESLPPTGTALSPYLTPTGNGYLYVASGRMQPFSAPGLNLGLLFFGAGTGISVPFN